MSAPECVVAAYDRPIAESNRRAVERFLRLRTAVVWCEPCQGYHVDYKQDRTGNGSYIDKLHRTVLERIAMGLRDPEIAQDLGISVKQVEHAVDRLSRQLNALSRPNLVTIAVALRVINPVDYIIKIATKERACG